MDQFLATQNDVTALYTKVEGDFNFETLVYIYISLPLSIN